ncbi:MAG: hypothetical protein ACUVXJ_15565 [Phycisphaerae bacterium]
MTQCTTAEQTMGIHWQWAQKKGLLHWQMMAADRRARSKIGAHGHKNRSAEVFQLRVFQKLLVMATVAASCGVSAQGQYRFSGRVWTPQYEGATDLYPFTAALVFASPEGSRGESVAFRTWETEPAGWFLLEGNAGRWTVLFARPGSFMRPIVLTNQYFEHRDEVVRHLAPFHDYAMLSPASWDTEPATDYYQTFVSRSRSLTHVGFMLAHDGVDGEGPGAQTLEVSVHRRGDGPPADWPQIGPTVPVPGVSSGGAFAPCFSASWNSGEVPLEPGQSYAVRLRGEHGFQCFWRPGPLEGANCYRVGKSRTGYTDHGMWMYIAGDGDGLLLPYNKRIQREWAGLTRFGRRWSQTYIARGRSLAGVMLYAAVAESQPPLREQQMWVRLRRGGPDGPMVGTAKIATGQGTAGACAGLIGAAFAPGEVPLEPGQRYAVQFDTLGSHAGFNPYRKHPLDPYEQGEAFFDGKERVDYDLDMLVIEFDRTADDWEHALAGRNLIHNGHMQAGVLAPDHPAEGGPEGWSRFATDPGTSWCYREDAEGNRCVGVQGGSINGKTVDGGWLSRVEGLSRLETYRLRVRVRSSWPVDAAHQAFVGYDATGQRTDPEAATIVWTVLPHVHGIFEEFVSPPIRPQADALSVWLRARTTFTKHKPFVVEFDDVRLHRVDAGVPDTECVDALYCGGEWDFEAGAYFTTHHLAGQSSGPAEGGNITTVPSDKWAHVANGWTHWASFPTWPTAGHWGVCSFNENKNPVNVYRGHRSQELTLTCANGEGVIYKRAEVPQGHLIRVEAYMKFTPNGDARPVEHAIGIDPRGGTDPASEDVQWTNWQEEVPSPPQPDGVFNRGTAETVSQGPVITVFIRQRAYEPPCQGQTFMIDNVKVYDDGPEGTAGPGRTRR